MGVAKLKSGRMGLVPSAAKGIIEALKKSGHQAYLVGGCVRDIIMGIKPNDYDICTSAGPSDTERAVTQAGLRLGREQFGKQFGTVVVIGGDGEEYEVTTFRTDITQGGKHRPDKVVYCGSLAEDLARRDFTINALALDISTLDIIDYHGGIKDIGGKIIRAVGEPNRRMKEDPVRILRALRFFVTLGFDIEGATYKAMLDNKKMLDDVSNERVTQEFRKMLTSGKDIKEAFSKASDIIVQVIPDIKPCIGFLQNSSYHKHNVYEHMLYVTDYCDTDDFTIKMAALLHDIAKPDAYMLGEDGKGHFYGHPEMSYRKSVGILVRRFSLTSSECMCILDLIRYHDLDIKDTPKSVKRALRKLGHDLFQKWMILKRADRADHIYPNGRFIIDMDNMESIYNELMEKEACFKIKDLAIGGNDVMEATDLKPCKEIGEILEKLLDLVIDGDIRNEREELLKRAKEMHSGDSMGD